MNKKGILESGLEFAAIYGVNFYCYLKNNPAIRRYAKNCLRRKMRREGKEYVRKRLWDE